MNPDKTYVCSAGRKVEINPTFRGVNIRIAEVPTKLSWGYQIEI